MRSRQTVTLLLLALFVTISIYYVRNPSHDQSLSQSQENKQKSDHPPSQPPEKDKQSKDQHGTDQAKEATDKPVKKPSKEESAPAYIKQSLPEAGTFIDSTTHPIDQLINDATKDFSRVVEKQSKTLSEAVEEYKRRYNAHPPPNFDKWYEFAKQKGVKLIDEYDSIYESLLPFWGLSPARLRGRVKQTLGFDNAMMGVTVRDGKVIMVQGGAAWQETATQEMIEKFVKYLPDMDLAFNVHDEPRISIAHDDLARLVQIAKNQVIPESFKNSSPKNKFSKANDIGDGEEFEEYRITEFNVFAHQATWSHSRQSCSPSSPARSLDEVTPDASETWLSDDGLFIKNKTAFSDICNSPSLKTSFGFFDRPNALSIAQDLFPIFSQSKVSSYQDILYPSPWYWADKVPYDPEQDFEWKDKQNQLYWRGSTTGGYSRNGGWRRQHRQQVVGYLSKNDDTTILSPVNTDQGPSKWSVEKKSKADFRDLMDVYFSGVGQCDTGDCDAQKEYFEVAEPAKQYDAWKYKYLLDIDGNAFSGRFYAFLRSHSAVFKMAIFREWHEEWIKPWVHYVPLSLSGAEYFETLRYFDRESNGKQQAVQIAENGRKWAGQALRNEDLEAFFFRLLLEYGRLLDDNRNEIGYKMADQQQQQQKQR